jgi:hypothetical protein
MKKRGRPKKNGLRPLWMLRRTSLAILAYDRSRRAGDKHSAAIGEAVAFIRGTDPRMRISKTEVKRILAIWRPRSRPFGLVVSEPDPSDSIMILPDGRKAKRLWIGSVGLRPTYPRSNAI